MLAQFSLHRSIESCLLAVARQAASELAEDEEVESATSSLPDVEGAELVDGESPSENDCDDHGEIELHAFFFLRT